MNSLFEAVDNFYDVNKNSDKSIPVARTAEFLFESETLRVWGGVGKMITPDGREWWGYMDGKKPNTTFIKLPKIVDPKTGNAPRYKIDIGYINDALYQELTRNDESVDGRLIELGKVLMPLDGATRSVSDVGDIHTLVMKGKAGFKESRSKKENGSYTLFRTATINASNINRGRSFSNFGSLNDAGQRFRSKALYQISNDSYAQFAVRYANGITIKF